MRVPVPFGGKAAVIAVGRRHATKRAAKAVRKLLNRRREDVLLAPTVLEALEALMLSACAYEKAGEYGEGERLTDLAARAVEFSRALEREPAATSRERVTQ